MTNRPDWQDYYTEAGSKHKIVTQAKMVQIDYDSRRLIDTAKAKGDKLVEELANLIAQLKK